MTSQPSQPSLPPSQSSLPSLPPTQSSSTSNEEIHKSQTHNNNSIHYNNTYNNNNNHNNNSHNNMIPFNNSIFIKDWERHILLVNSKPYLKLSKIGKGGSSKVYKALRNDGEVCAIKYVDLTDADTSTKDTYIEEIQLLSKLQQSECIIKLLDSDISNTSIKIVLECGDIDLAKMLQKHKGGLLYSQQNYLRLYWQQMLEAVEVVHKQNIVHGVDTTTK
eukprot:TRINITY_DN7688_c0_g1_i1.p1 TRINITY_DN7688_c0_g1~~TRINITY_DN7688_c0_g1_i1.p1  ORF type:complete len:219 (-),score=66.56 TRINITY_DN7688_c0_g1_i1:243-899(-)